MYDEDNSICEDRYNTIGNIMTASDDCVDENCIKSDAVLFVVYTDRVCKGDVTVIRLISARRATNFERGLYYGNC